MLRIETIRPVSPPAVPRTHGAVLHVYGGPTLVAMARMTGSWLSGPRAALPRDSDGKEQRYRGEQLGLPEAGVGSLASTLRRAAAFILDIGLAALTAFAFTAPHAPGNWSLLVWFVMSFVTVALFSVTPGQAMVGIGVARVDVTAPVGLWRALVRVLLTFVIVPVVVWDADTRGLHDRVTSTAVIRSR